jgi:molybdopterin/thiamine biosynthesis adenylyltransferase
MRRYERQIRIFGMEGQRKLEKASVLIVGLGGLGSAAATYLAMGGVGTLILVDKDIVEESNLNRQSLHWSKDVGQLKILSAEEKLKRINPSIAIETYPKEITKENVKDFVVRADVVLDCLDNFETRFILNEACVKEKVPLVHAAVESMEGRLMVVEGKPCLKCFYKKAPISMQFPILGTTAGALGCLQASEAIKLITGYGKPLIGKMIVVNLEKNTFEVLEVKPDPNCPVCSK